MSAVFLLAPISSPGLNFVSGPTFTPAANAPLAGRLQLATDVECRVSISVSDGISIWGRDFYAFATNQSIPLVGFKPGRINTIHVTATDKQRNALTAEQALTFVTSALPSDFPNLTVVQSQTNLMEPGYTLFRVAYQNGTKAYHVIVNNGGEVVWYSALSSQLDVRPLENGNLFVFSTSTFSEINLLGETVQTWSAAPNYPIDVHDGLPTSHGTILYLSPSNTVVEGYPTSLTDPNAPLGTASNLIYQRAVEISTNGSSVLHSWSLIDLLDPRRITYMTTLGPAIWDSEHSNAIIEDPSDDSVIVSLRHQNAIVKISRATGALVWILGPPNRWSTQWQPYLLTPTGSPFGWQYAQHSPLLTPWGTLMVYDDGNYRASPFNPPIADQNNFSRAVEYLIDQDHMTVSQVWEYGSQASEVYYTDKVGDAEALPETGNVLITFGSVRYINGVPPSSYGAGATIARIQEVTHDTPAQLVFDLRVSEIENAIATHDCFVYRSRRIRDLYAHPAMPVADLAVSSQGDSVLLQFSGDPTHKYYMEASPDLEQWERIGSATAETAGDFKFSDAPGPDQPIRYYRVLTQ